MIYNIPTIGVSTPTDQDYGRLYRFDGAGDAGIIMPPRSYYFRDFFPGGWSELAIGLILAATASTGETDTTVDENLISSNFANLFHFGMSQSSAGAINVAANPNFVGLRGRLGGSPQLIASVPKLSDNEFVCLQNGSSQVSGYGKDVPLTQGVSAEPFAMIGIKFVHDKIHNRLHLHYAKDDNISLADENDNVTKLTTFLNGISNSTLSSDANFGIVDLSAYKSYYIFWPYVLNRLKLHCVGAVKYA